MGIQFLPYVGIRLNFLFHKWIIVHKESQKVMIYIFYLILIFFMKVVIYLIFFKILNIFYVYILIHILIKLF